jgi:Subtilase family/Fervidolysin N-terminal prodomain
MVWHRHASVASLLGMALLVGIAYGSPGPPAGQRAALPAQGHRAQKYVSGQLLVRFRAGLNRQAMQAQHAQVGAAVLKEFHVVKNLQLVRLPTGMTVPQARRLYRARPDVLYAEPNYLRYTVQSPLVPNDPLYPDMWNLHNTGQAGGTPGADIHAPQAWGLITGRSSVVVAVIDTGIDYKHPDLAANVWSSSSSYTVTLNGKAVTCAAGTHGFNAITQTCDPMDDDSHGTHVSGIIGADGNNGTGVAGVNWQVQLMACKFLDSSGSGSTADAITCLEYVALMKDSGVNLVATNNSYGGVGFSQAEMDAIDSHRQRGVLFIAAAGNAHSNNDFASFYPANYGLPHMIAVAASDRRDTLADFSNFGRHTVHLSAPGKEILSTVPGGQYEVYSGTSMAAPHVTGMAALLKAQDSTRDWKAIKNLMLAGGDTVSGLSNTIAQKRLNAYGAMTCSNSVLQSRLLPMADDAYVWGGDSLSFAVLSINCASPNGPVEISVDGGAGTISLADDGIGPDLEADDGIYVGRRQWLASEIGDHTLTFPNREVVTVHVVPPLAAYTYSTAVPFSYRDIAGTDLLLGDDNSAMIRPPFPIQFGGFNFPTFNVNTNGNVTFFAPYTEWFNSPLPAAPYIEWDNSWLPASGAATMVAPFWDDLATRKTGSVRWEVTGTAPNRELVIEWRDIYHTWCDVDMAGMTAKFQIVFFENSSDILFNYADVTFGGAFDPFDGPCFEIVYGGANATVGVQSTNTLANQFSFMTPSLTDNSSILWQIGNLTPSITQLSPISVLAGAPGFSLQVIGRSFLRGAVIRWNGSDRPTTYVHASELTATISAGDLASAGTAQITVFNPAPNGGPESAPVPFNIYSSYPKPTLTSFAPNPFSEDLGMMLTLTGTGFVSGSVVRWNGVDRPFDLYGSNLIISSNQLEMVPFAVDTEAAGTAQVTVFNPAPGGGSSNALTLSIVNPVPRLKFLSPGSVSPGGPAFTLWAFGANFNKVSVVRWNGSDRPTRHAAFSSVRFIMSAAIRATDIASPGTAEVTVFTPTPGGGTSNPVMFSIAPPPFKLESNPNSQTLPRGSTATYTITITPQLDSFNAPIFLSCSVAPAGPTCSFSQSSVTPGAVPATATLTVVTSNVASLEKPGEPAPLFAFCLALPMFGLFTSGRIWTDAKKAKAGIVLALVLMVVLLGMLVACGGGSSGGGGGSSGSTSPPPQPGSKTYTITVVGTSGTISQQTTTSLTVTP